MTNLRIGNLKANQNEELIDLLTITKVAGMCGTFKQMATFQESTKMPGGDEFILRFMNTEAARLGKTLPQFLNECKSAVDIYTKTMEE